MKSFLLSCVVATALLGTAAPARAQVAQGPCDSPRFLRITPRESHPELIRNLIACATRRWPVYGGAAKADAVANCESSYWPWANNGGTYLGVYQHSASSWVGRVNDLLKARWFNAAQWDHLHTTRGAYVARANVLVMARMVHNGGWGPWTCA